MNKEEIDYITHHEGSEIEEFVIDGYNFRSLLLQLTEANEKLEKIKKYIDENKTQKEYTDAYGFRVKENSWFLMDIEDILEIIKGSDNK